MIIYVFQQLGRINLSVRSQPGDFADYQTSTALEHVSLKFITKLMHRGTPGLRAEARREKMSRTLRSEDLIRSLHILHERGGKCVGHQCRKTDGKNTKPRINHLRKTWTIISIVEKYLLQS